jgi:molybdate transport system ATP-binding protein
MFTASHSSLILLRQVNACQPEFRFKESVSLEIGEGESIAITGPNGSGKSRLVDYLFGRRPLTGHVAYHFGLHRSEQLYEQVAFLEFKDIYSNEFTPYYQLRWNQQEINEQGPLVGEWLDRSFQRGGQPESWRNELYERFGMWPLLDKYPVLLSSGEIRRLQLVKALLTNPKVLVVDNPYIGLDEVARCSLTEVLRELACDKSITVILVLSRWQEIPDFITHVIPVQDLRVGEKMPASVFLSEMKKRAKAESNTLVIPDLPLESASEGADEWNGWSQPVLEMKGVTIRYGERVILKELDWLVQAGEHWAVIGENGAGKSTLLSLVYADNPQAYACDISLFGRRRGSGESIWDIKRRIGFVSPEMYRSYCRNLPVIDIVASGWFDSIGLYRKPLSGQLETARKWMAAFGLSSLENRSFLTLSGGEQRLVLLARAFVKNPALLVLDEPMHGLDNRHSELVKGIIDAYALQPGKTLMMVTHFSQELPACINRKIRLIKQEN